MLMKKERMKEVLKKMITKEGIKKGRKMCTRPKMDLTSCRRAGEIREAEREGDIGELLQSYCINAIITAVFL